MCTSNNYENLENPCLELEIEFVSRSMSCSSGRVISVCLHREILPKKLQCLPKIPIYTKRDKLDEVIIVEVLWKRVDQSHSTM